MALTTGCVLMASPSRYPAFLVDRESTRPSLAFQLSKHRGDWPVNSQALLRCPLMLHPVDHQKLGTTPVRFPEIQVYNSTWFADYPIKQQNIVISRGSCCQLEGRRVAGRRDGRRGSDHHRVLVLVIDHLEDPRLQVAPQGNATVGRSYPQLDRERAIEVALADGRVAESARGELRPLGAPPRHFSAPSFSSSDSKSSRSRGTSSAGSPFIFSDLARGSHPSAAGVVFEFD